MDEIRPSRQPKHKDNEARSLAMHTIIAKRLLDDPRLLEKTREVIARWRPEMDVRSVPYLDAWEAVLDKGVDAVVALLTDPGEFGAQMRQATPFVNILSQKERNDFLREWRIAREKI